MDLSRAQTRWQKAIVSLLFGITLVALPILLGACGSTTTGGGSSTPTSNALPCPPASSGSAPTPTPFPTTTSLTAPTDLITPGTLTVGSDTTYPPQEYIDTKTGQAAGFDVDLITAIAERMGLKAKIVTTGFDTIIDSLSAKRFDVVISAITINPDRQKKVDFVPYFSAGESLLVPKGNPKNITTIGGMCGLKV